MQSFEWDRPAVDFVSKKGRCNDFANSRNANKPTSNSPDGSGDETVRSCSLAFPHTHQWPTSSSDQFLNAVSRKSHKAQHFRCQNRLLRKIRRAQDTWRAERVPFRAPDFKLSWLKLERVDVLMEIYLRKTMPPIAETHSKTKNGKWC